MKRSDEEHTIQTNGVALCRQVFPICCDLLYAVPNGGARDAVTGKRLKDEGVLPGVFDLALDVTKMTDDGSLILFIPGLKIEVKTPAAYRKKNHGLTPEQMAYKANVELHGYKTAIVCSSQMLFDVVREYLEG